MTVQWIVLAICGLALLAVAWVAGVRWYYRPRTDPAERLTVACSDGWELGVLLRRARERRFAEPVLLCHGLAASRLNFDFQPPYSLAHFLCEAGFDCYVVDFRGTGLSSRPPKGRGRWDFSVDDHIERDAPALIELALRSSGAARAFWVGHSLGGLIGYAASAGAGRERLAGLVAIGAPAFFRYDRWLQKVVRAGARFAWPNALHHRQLSAALAPFLGYLTLPLSDVIVNPRHIPPRIQRQVYATMMASIGRRVLRQFDDWIAHDAFRSEDRTRDYREAIRELSAPLLVLGGIADRLASPAAARAQFELAGTSDKTLVVLGPEHGDALEYGHGDLMFGSGAPAEVYPLVQRWLAARATALGAPSALSAAR